MLTGVAGLGAPHFFMLQVFLKEKFTLSHFGQVQSPSESPSGPTDENFHKQQLINRNRNKKTGKGKSELQQLNTNGLR